MKAFLKTNLLLLSCLYTFFAQSQILEFKKFSINQGLPHSDVTSIAQDSLGFLWFGTYNGLCRFDGYSTKIFRYDQNDQNSISNNRILTVYTDRSNNLWIGTELGGLNKLNLTNYHIENMFHDPNIEGSLSSNFVKAVYEDDAGTIWVGTNKGLNELNNNTFNHYLNSNTTVNTITGENHALWIGTGEGLIHFNTKTKGHLFYGSIEYGAVNHILQDSKDENILWLGMGNGLYRFDKTLKTFEQIYSSEVLTVVYDHLGNIWYGTRNDGVFEIEVSGRTFHYKKSTLFNEGLSNNEVSSIFEDYSGVMWIGTLGGGTNFYDTRQKKFELFKIRPNLQNSLSSDVIICFNQDNNQHLWVGTRGGGINILNRETGVIQHFDKFVNEEGLKHNNISAFYRDKLNNLLVGTWGGLYVLDAKGQEQILNNKEPEYTDVLSAWNMESASIFRIQADNEGHIWIGTNQGLLEYIPNEAGDYTHGELKHYTKGNDLLDLSDNTITDLLVEAVEHDTKIVWVATRNGLNKMVLKEDKVSSVQKIYHDPDKKDGLTANYISFLHKDSTGQLWIGTLGGGLCRMLNSRNDNTFSFEAFTQNNGLINNDVEAILEDAKGNFWLSGEGITKFNYDKKTFRHYTVEDGLQSNSFKIWSAYKNDSGELMFGGINGFNIFNPENIIDNPIPPKVSITELKVFNKVVEPNKNVNGDIILTNAINQTSKINLKHNLNNFTLGFSALHYTSPKNNIYKYKLEGADENWSFASGDKRSISYANLNSGDYTFKIMAANSDGVWGKPISLDIIIETPWWFSDLAFVFYALVFLGLLYMFNKYALIRVNEKNRLEMESVLHKQTEEINQLKLRFFTDISHEIRTPLSLIVAPIKEILNDLNLSKNAFTKIKIVERNVNMLSRLANEIMDFSKYEKRKMGIYAAKGDIISFLQEIKSHFDYTANRRGITYTFYSKEKELFVWFEKNKLEKVIFNLLSNAFKFTQDNGEIRLVCKKNTLENFVEVSVFNTGLGIPGKELPHIFKRYYQLENDTKHTGSGIGLSLSKYIIEQHKGKIWAESELNKHAIFKFQIPLGNMHFTNDELMDKAAAFSPDLYDTIPESLTEETKSPAKNTTNLNVLVVEDNGDLRVFLKNSLSKFYNITEAENGEKAFDLVGKTKFDLVISDVMMPVMDGITLCHKLKTTISTSHIPIILLTAKSSISHKLDGYKTGADDYITKPFDLELLHIRAKNLIESRLKLQDRFKQTIYTNPKEITVTSLDEKLLKKCLAIIEENMSDTEFSVESLCTQIGVSRSQLYRKIMALTNMSINNFIRTVRLKRAAQILIQDDSSVFDVMNMVGFSNNSYFTRAFKAQFGCTPKQYKTKFSKTLN
jgi:signal transduction histidine kinase/ligand-binding sensor domain-containing protein/DNA-binding response OmpR family regulator